jgi:multisubunit Na+/H+ antiporter MnhE subunit
MVRLPLMSLVLLVFWLLVAAVEVDAVMAPLSVVAGVALVVLSVLKTFMYHQEPILYWWVLAVLGLLLVAQTEQVETLAFWVV